MTSEPNTPALGEVRSFFHGVKLADLPEELRNRLERYDYNKNGTIDPEELPISSNDDGISVKAFPPAIRDSLFVFDKVSATDIPTSSIACGPRHKHKHKHKRTPSSLLLSSFTVQRPPSSFRGPSCHTL